MKFKRTLSLLLSAALVTSSLPITAFAVGESPAPADAVSADDWVALSGDTELDITEIDETGSGAPDTLTYDRISDIADTKSATVMAYRVCGPNTGATGDLLLKKSTSYAVSFYARAMPDVNEAWNADPNAAKASADNKMTLDVFKGYGDANIGSFELTEDWTYYECTGPIKTGTSDNYRVQFIFARSLYGGEDVVPVDIDKVTFTELDASGNPVGDPIVPPAEWRTDIGGKVATIIKADQVYSHVEVPTTPSEVNIGGVVNTQTVISKTGLGTTVCLAGSDDKTLPAGGYNLSGSFRLGWFDHKDVTMSGAIVSDFGNTATLNVYKGSELLGTAALGLTDWSKIDCNFDIAEDTKMSELRFEIDKLASFDYKDLELAPTYQLSRDWSVNDGSVIEYGSDADEGWYLHAPATDSASAAGLTFRQLDAALSTSADYTLSFKARVSAVNNFPVDSWDGTLKLNLFEWYMEKNLGTVTLTEEWKEFNIPVVPGGARKHTVFVFMRGDVGGNFLPLDISNLSLVNNKTGEEIITENIITNWHETTSTGSVNWNAGGQTAEKYEPFTGADMRGASDTKIYSADETVLEAGRYLISGSFRLAAYDYDTNGVGSLTAYADGSALDSVNISSEWTDVSFVLDINEDASLKDIDFALDAGDASINFKDFAYERIYSFSGDWEMADGTPAILVDETDAVRASYLRVPAGAEGTGVIYRYIGEAGTVTLSAQKEYTLSFKARSIGELELTLFNEYWWGQELISTSTSNNLTSTEKADKVIRLNEDWRDISITFKPSADRKNIVFNFDRRNVSGTDLNVLPFDIAYFTITDTATGETVLPENTLENWSETVDQHVNWGEGLQYEALPTAFIRARVDSATDTKIYAKEDTVLESGRYVISGSFRLSEYNYDTNGSGTLTAYANGVALEDTAAIGTEWSFAEFTFDINGDASLSDIGFAFDAGNTVLDFKDISYKRIHTFFDGFTTADGTPVLLIEQEDVGEYLYVPAGAEGTGVIYRYIGEAGTVTLSAAKEYILSFKARSLGELDVTLFNEYWWGQDLVTGSSSSNLTAEEIANKAIRLNENWRDISITFKPSGDRKNIVLNFDRQVKADTDFNILPFDIACLSIKDAATGEEVLPENTLENWSETVDQHVNWGAGAQRMTTSPASFYRVEPSSSGVTEVFASGSDTFEPGKYYIKGTFRLGEYDFAKNGEDELIAKLAGTPLTTLSGSSSAQLSTEWKEVTFVADIAVDGLSHSDISFMLADGSVLDMRDISYELVERYVSLSDVNSGFIMVLLALKLQERKELGFDAPWKANGEELEVVNNVLDEKTGEIGTGSAASNSYIHAYNRDNNMDRLVYENKEATLSAGTYKLTFYARTSDYINASIKGRNPAALLRLYIGDGRTTQVPVISSVKSGPADPNNANNIMLTSSWTKYSYTFKLSAETPFIFAFEGSGAGYGWCPIDIDGFTLVNVDSGSGENLAVNSDKLIGVKQAGWSAVAVDNKGVVITAEVLRESAYQTTDVPSTDKNIVTSTAYGDIEPGKYYLTAKVRLGNIDFAKYAMGDTADALLSDNNKAGLSAVLGDMTLMTEEGIESITVTPEWKTVTFVVDVKEKIAARKLKMILDAPYSLEFDFINFGEEINTEDADTIGKPIVDENGNILLPALPEITEGNLVAGYDEASRLAYWSYGEQTLEVKTDENGDRYFAASNITSSSLGFTYKPGYSIAAGEYKFSAMVRTSVPGEVTWLRAMVGNKSGAAYVTNDWKRIEFTFTVEKPTELIVKLCGAPRNSCVQDYEFKNITIYDKNYVPFGENLTTGGDFENPLNGTAGWVPAYSNGGTVTRMTDEDGNSYLRASDRPESHYPIALDLGFVANIGDTFTISYDIRTAVEGEEMTIRTYLGSIATGGTGLNVSEPYSAANPVRYSINNEWRHVEHTYTATKAEEFILQIKGGPGAEDNKDFDIDNIVIIKKEIELVDPAEHYTTGDFDDEETALNSWKIGWGEGTAVWNKEGDNGYITATGRLESPDPLYYNGGFVTIPGTTYKISYDIRTSNAGDSMRIRPYFGTLAVVGVELTVDPIEFAGMPGRYSITHEWKHVEHIITASGYETFAVQLRGGPGADENKDFDVDNFKVEIVY